MILKTAICDDEESGIKLICKLLDHYSIDTDIEFERSIFNDPDELLKTYVASGRYDIIFLDVEMSTDGIDKNGIDTAKAIRSLPDKDVRIIYISNYPVYMQMSFDVQASNYLSKDVSFERFHTVMDMIIHDITEDTSLIRIKTGSDQWNLLRTRDIICIRSVYGKRNRVSYYTIDHEYCESGTNILTIGERLRDKHFIFANKYCLVNMRHVLQYSHDHLQLSNQESIEISRHFRKQFIEQFSKNILTL